MAFVNRVRHSLDCSRLEPVAAVGDPPGGVEDGDGGGASPPEGQQDVGQQAEQHEYRPEDLFLHESDFTRCGSRAKVQRFYAPP